MTRGVMDGEASARVLRAAEELRRGRPVILVDDEDRENEGDLVLAAEHVTPEAINFMVREARGLVCLALTEEKVRALELPMMTPHNRSARCTAFTVSIEAREGVTTGISAADRAHTIRTAVAPDARPDDLVSPGHVFPLQARPGGVLQRAGHTEGSVDLARIAGCLPAAVICEIMNDDGTMARQPELVAFARRHQLALLSIADVIQYRLQTERLVHRVRSGPVRLGSGGTWTAHVYVSSVETRQMLALVHGDVDETPTLVRVHTGSVLGDVFGVRRPLRFDVHEAVERIEREGRGVVLFLPGRVDLERDLAAHLGEPLPAAETDPGDVLREFGLGAQVLRDLGLRRIRLLTHRPRRIVGLEGFGLELVESPTGVALEPPRVLRH
ncbi:MAG: 3,4-dihydroxy-2-butanone-4-phosphate synthase [Myxococcota bacterium]|nr:3,4-dihydroxy-2-butanone-4-phosphate synthase [Myxococcota bacterium]